MLKNLLKRQKEDELLPPPPPFPPLEEGKEEDLWEGLGKGSDNTPSFNSTSQIDELKDFSDAFKPETHEAEQEIMEAVQKLKEKPSFWKRFFSMKRGMPKPEKQEIDIKPEIDGVLAIHNLIKESRDALLALKLDKAKEAYLEANRIYHQLPPERQKEIYEELKSLYDERKSAEAMKLG